MFAVIAMVLIAATAFSAKKQVSPEMLAIRKVYITGHHQGQIEWALKNFPQNKGSCLRPVSTPEEADAILQIEPTYPDGERPAKYESPTWVDCTSSRNSTHCVDSNGYATDTSCSTDRGGNVNCTTTYGPDLGASLVKLLGAAARRTSVDVYLYDKTGKHLLWKDEQGTTFLHVWGMSLMASWAACNRSALSLTFAPVIRAGTIPRNSDLTGNSRRRVKRKISRPNSLAAQSNRLG